MNDREEYVEAQRLARMATTLEVWLHIWMNDHPNHLCIPVNIYV
jgi:hypothetical protein